MKYVKVDIKFLERVLFLLFKLLPEDVIMTKEHINTSACVPIDTSLLIDSITKEDDQHPDIPFFDLDADRDIKSNL